MIVALAIILMVKNRENQFNCWWMVIDFATDLLKGMKKFWLQTRTVKVSNVSLNASEQHVEGYFSISGDIEYVEMRRLCFRFIIIANLILMPLGFFHPNFSLPLSRQCGWMLTNCIRHLQRFPGSRECTTSIGELTSQDYIVFISLHAIHLLRSMFSPLYAYLFVDFFLGSEFIMY